MSETLWIDASDEGHGLGDCGFLIHKYNHVSGSDYYVISDYPAHTNQSHRARLWGWCGSHNDNNTYAWGMVKVAKVAKNGRLFVREIDGDELAAALEELGYPELFSQKQEEEA